MLQCKRQNTHHSKLPRPGAIVTVRNRPLGPNRRWRKFIVESYPLRDDSYSLGIHTCIIRALDNNQRFRVAGHYCHDEGWDD
jgi:hypothetical protein